MPVLTALEPSHDGSLGERVYTRLAAAILDGTLAAGRQVRDVELAAELGVSRTPVREALLRLERSGLVEIAVGRHTRITEVSDELRRDTADFAVRLLGNALHLAVPTCSESELTSILAACDRMQAAADAGDGPELFATTTQMSRLATIATRNRMLLSVMREAQLAIERNLADWPPFVEHQLAHPERYRELRAAIAARDATAAESAFRRLHELS